MSEEKSLRARSLSTCPSSKTMIIIDYHFKSPETGFASRKDPETLTSILLVALLRGQL